MDSRPEEKAFSNLLTFVFLFFLFFSGEPDLQDAIIKKVGGYDTPVITEQVDIPK